MEKTIRKVIVSILGAMLMLIGIILLVLPGPGVVVLLLGLGVLGTEFPVAKRLMRKLAKKADQTLRSWKDRRLAK